MSALDLANQLRAKFGDLLSTPAEFHGEITLKLADAERIAEVCEFAKRSLAFDMLLDLSSVDNYGELGSQLVGKIECAHDSGISHG